jgi:protein-tyrosine phosphatase
MVKHDEIDASEIAPGLWQGSIPPRGKKLSRLGFDQLVLSAREWQFKPEQFPGVDVVNAPNDDHAELYPLTRDKLRTAVQAARGVVEALARGQKVLVTCAGGMNRSGLVSALSLHLLYGWAGIRCIQEVRAKRGPGKDGYTPLSNDEFVDVLSRLPARQPPAEVLLLTRPVNI